MTAPDRQQVIADALARHDLFGPEGIPADGEVAWLRCPCGWSLNYEMPEDDMALVNREAMKHLAQVATAALAASNAGADPADGQAVACECPPCLGRGIDGHGMTHCAECCFGTGVEADIGCPIHGGQAVAEGLSEDEVRAIGTRLAGVMDGAVDDAARWLAPTVEAILAARRGQDAERALERVQALADNLERESRICSVGNTATIAARLRAAAGGTP